MNTLPLAQPKLFRRARLSMLASAVAVLLGLVVPQAEAYPVDTLLGASDLGNSSVAAQTSALATLLGVGADTLTMDFKYDSSDTEFNFHVNPGGGWFIDVGPAAPEFFALKFGTGGTRATADTYFFRNVADLDKLVWTNDQVQFLTGGDCRDGDDRACNIGRLSHFAGFDEVAVSVVSEPATVALVALGLAGSALSRRRR